MKQLFHQHFLLKAFIENAPKSETQLNKWLEQLVKDIQMNVCIDARSKYVDIPGNRGLTGQIGIETSHIAIHIWDEQVPAMLQLDVYSCKEFDIATVLTSVNEFNLQEYEFMLLDRNNTFKVILQKTGYGI